MTPLREGGEMDRREFAVKSGQAVALAGTASFLGSSASANNIVQVAVVGIRGRGRYLARYFGERKDVRVKYLCDIDSRIFDDRQKEISELTGKTPECEKDFRRVLDDGEIDAIVFATPDHWHALGTIWACQAGKDVFVEKPASYSIWEGQQMVKAARKYDRVVQLGTQNRSATYCLKAKEYVDSGALGTIHFARVLNSKNRKPVPVRPNQEVPEGVDYGMWLGPARLRPFNENHFHYSWHWLWEYSGGDIINDGVHQVDIARWLLGVKCPLAVASGGGKYFFEGDAQDTPGTHTVTWDFEKMTVQFEQTLWTPYMRKTPMEVRDSDNLPAWPFSGTRVEIYGSKQKLFLSRHGGGWQAFDGDGKSLHIEHGRQSNEAHVANFIDCIRSRKRPNSDIEGGHLSTNLCHYGNIAFRTGKRLAINPDTEDFRDEEANQYLRRKTYRNPWIVPEEV